MHYAYIYLSHFYVAFQIFNWQPDFYNDTNKLPEKMPNDLKNHIKQSITQNAATVSANPLLFIFFSFFAPLSKPHSNVEK